MPDLYELCVFECGHAENGVEESADVSECEDLCATQYLSDDMLEDEVEMDHFFNIQDKLLKDLFFPAKWGH